MAQDIETTTSTKTNKAVRVSIMFVIGTAVAACLIGIAAVIGRMTQS